MTAKCIKPHRLQPHRLQPLVAALIFTVSVCFMHAEAVTVTSSDWNYPSALFPTLNQAGGYFNTSLESAGSAAHISINSAPSAAVSSNSECGATDPAWKLSAELITVTSGLTIKVKRTDNGTGGTLLGGVHLTVFCRLFRKHSGVVGGMYLIFHYSIK